VNDKCATVEISGVKKPTDTTVSFELPANLVVNGDGHVELLRSDYTGVNKEHGLKFGDERYTIIKMRSVFKLGVT